METNTTFHARTWLRNLTHTTWEVDDGICQTVSVADGFTKNHGKVTNGMETGQTVSGRVLGSLFREGLNPTTSLSEDGSQFIYTLKLSDVIKVAEKELVHGR